MRAAMCEQFATKKCDFFVEKLKIVDSRIWLAKQHKQRYCEFVFKFYRRMTEERVVLYATANQSKLLFFKLKNIVQLNVHHISYQTTFLLSQLR